MKNTKFNQKEYINNYQKNKYKMYQFRVRKDDDVLINKLDNLKNRNNYIVSTLSKSFNGRNGIYTIAQLKKIIKPILSEYGINEVYLFGSYARGEANEKSDIDIYCEDGKLVSLLQQIEMEQRIKESLGKEVDIVYMNSNITDLFKNNIKEDLIKIC